MDQVVSTNALENCTDHAKELYKEISELTPDTDEEKINEVYDKFIESSNIVPAEDHSEENFPEVKLEENRSENLNSEDVLVSHNPVTGEQTVVENGISFKNMVDRQLDSLNRIDSKQLESMDKDMLLKTILESDIIKNDNSDDGIMAHLMLRRMMGENFNPYNEFPDKMKREVDNIVAKTAELASKTHGQNPQIVVSRMFLDSMISDFKSSITGEAIDLDTMLSGFDKDLEEASNQMATEVGNMMMSLDEQRKAEIDAAIKRCEEEGKEEAKNKLLKMRETIDDAFNLNKFSEACKDIKIKRGDLKKPDRVFDSFNFKYENHKNNINNIKDCRLFLSRHLKQYTDTHKLMLCLAFCKYCMNFSPDNIEEHTFMYYFIRNIIALDRLNPKGNIYESMDEASKKFYDNFSGKLAECMDNLISRNPEVAEETF